LLEVLGLASQRDKLAGVLSGGMGRRLNLALALVHDPEILVLDEPEAGLDPHSRVLVRDYIRSLARQKTIILTTHNMDEADRMADRVAIIDHGKLLVLDTPAALKATIGEGDVLELEVSGIPAQHAFTAVQAQFPGLGTALQPGIRPGEGSAGPPAPQPAPTQGGPGAGSPQPVRGQVVNFRGKDIITKLPAILAAIQDAGGEVADVRLRANTLEDVFITLTGRSLRQ
jgi:ABC-2 type transport system ATP-binding protein